MLIKPCVHQGYAMFFARVSLPSTGLGGEAWPKCGATAAQEATNRLTFTEGRLSFDFAEVTTRPESQAVGRPCGWPMILALTFWSFLVKQKGQ